MGGGRREAATGEKDGNALDDNNDDQVDNVIYDESLIDNMVQEMKTCAESSDSKTELNNNDDDDVDVGRVSSMTSPSCLDAFVDVIKAETDDDADAIKELRENFSLKPTTPIIDMETLLSTLDHGILPRGWSATMLSHGPLMGVCFTHVVLDYDTKDGDWRKHLVCICNDYCGIYISNENVCKYINLMI